MHSFQRSESKKKCFFIILMLFIIYIISLKMCGLGYKITAMKYEELVFEEKSNLN